MRRTCRLARTVWLRGFMPAAVLFLLGAFSSWSWIVWQAPGAQPFRTVLGRGVLAADWNSSPGGGGIGRINWCLGVLIDPKTLAPKPGWIVIFPTTGPSVDCDLEVHAGHTKIPLLPLAVAAALPPALLAVWRWHRPGREAWQCPRCRYDLRGAMAPTCPECGTARQTAARS